MTRAWNTGISQYSVGRYKAAEQWCGLAMRFLGHLGTLKSSYESQVRDKELQRVQACSSAPREKAFKPTAAGLGALRGNKHLVALTGNIGRESVSSTPTAVTCSIVVLCK